MVRLLRPNLREYLEANLGSNILISRYDAEYSIRRLSTEKKFGRFGFELLNKINNNISVSQERIFLDENFYQINYDKLKSKLSCEVVEFLYNNFGKSASNLYYLTHIVNASNKINKNGISIMSPLNPERSKLRLIVASKHNLTSRTNELCNYLTSLTLCNEDIRSLEALPFRYITNDKLESILKGKYYIPIIN